MKVRAMFLGEDGSMGFKKYRYYDFQLIGNTIHCKNPSAFVPYSTVESFLNNWQVARTS